VKDLSAQTNLAIHTLSTGLLELDIQIERRGGLFKLAERQNPRRAFLFVSTVLGRHIPVAPKDHRDALNTLCDMARPHFLGGAVFVMGFAETAVGIGAGVFDSLRKMLPGRELGYLHTTRHPLPGTEPWFAIEEGHSHATSHFIMRPTRGCYYPGPASTLVLVDDETTTGNTFAELAGGLFENGARFGKIVLVTLTDWSNGAAAERVKSVVGDVPVEAVSLLEGSWTWTQDPDADLPSLPVVAEAGCPVWEPEDTSMYRSPRDGLRGRDMSNGEYLAWKAKLPRFKRKDRVLVIGTGEHVWQPFLYAEAVETDGLDVGFICTTRSPILPGPVIEHKITFPDHFGLGLDMYLHNVNPDDWDRIVLFTETGIEGIHPRLRVALGKGHIVDKDGQVFEMMDT
jgi:hypothetical protein